MKNQQEDMIAVSHMTMLDGTVVTFEKREKRVVYRTSWGKRYIKCMARNFDLLQRPDGTLYWVWDQRQIQVVSGDDIVRKIKEAL